MVRQRRDEGALMETQSHSADDSMSDDGDKTARLIGRGILVITGAKLWFMIGGVAITFGLPFIFDRIHDNGRALYGQYYDLNNILSILSMMMVTGVMQSISRFVAQRPNQSGGIARQGIRMMVLLGGLVAGTLIVGSPILAESRGNPELVNGYRAAGLIVFAYGIYTVCIGCLNGRKAFVQQASFDLAFTTLKATLVLGLAAMGLGVIGAFSGFALAAAIITVAALIIVARRLEEGPKEPSLVGYTLQVMLYTVVFNLIFKLDGILVKPALLEMYGAFMEQPEPKATIGALFGINHFAPDFLQNQVDSLMGNYGMAVAMSRLPWQGTIAITFVIFPLMSEAVFAEDKVKTRLYIRQTLRYSMMVIGVAATVLVAQPEAPFRLLPQGYGSGAHALVWLAPAYFCFSLFNIANTLLISSGRAGLALLISLATVSLTAVAYSTVLPMETSPIDLLVTASQLTLGAFSVGLIFAVAILWKIFGSPLPGATVVRVILSGILSVYLCSLLPQLSIVMGLVAMMGAALIFGFSLWLLREFDEADWMRLRSVFGRKRS